MCGQVCANLAVHVGRNHADQDFSCSQVTLLFLLAGNMLASTSAVSAKTLQFILAGIMPTRTLAVSDKITLLFILEGSMLTRIQLIILFI